MLYAEDAGWCHEARYAFNAAVYQLVTEFERMQRRTKLKTVQRPRHSRSTYQKEVPYYTEAELLAFWDVDVNQERARQVIAQSLTPEMFATLDDGEWAAEPP